MRFEGRTVIVTGGESGVGLACARRFALEGAHVVIAGREQAAADKAVAELAGGPAALAVACDVADEAACERCCERAVARFGRLDVVVNNAGTMTFAPLVDTDTADFLQVLQVDLLGSFHFIKHGLRRTQAGGAIVNVASIHAERTGELAGPYAAAKAGLLSLTRTAAVEARERRIRVNAVLPGAVDTPMLWDNPNVKSGEEPVAPGRLGQPAQVAAAVAFLASDDASFITGAALAVDGGALAQL